MYIYQEVCCSGDEGTPVVERSLVQVAVFQWEEGSGSGISPVDECRESPTQGQGIGRAVCVTHVHVLCVSCGCARIVCVMCVYMCCVCHVGVYIHVCVYVGAREIYKQIVVTVC